MNFSKSRSYFRTGRAISANPACLPFAPVAFASIASGRYFYSKPRRASSLLCSFLSEFFRTFANPLFSGLFVASGVLCFLLVARCATYFYAAGPSRFVARRDSSCFDQSHEFTSVAPSWRRAGSNRQPLACKASALPIELRPRWERSQSSYAGFASVPLLPGISATSGRGGVSHVVRRRLGLVRIELTTLPLSGARSSQLSYRPVTTGTKTQCNKPWSL